MAGALVTDGWGGNALVKAADGGHTEIVKMLLDARVGIDVERFRGPDALFNAVNRGHSDIVKMLLAVEVSPFFSGRHGDTPLMVAAKNGFIDIVRLLVPHGKTLLDSSNVQGKTALSLAVEHKHVEIASLLIDAGADLQCRPHARKPYNLVNMAIESDSVELTRMLLAAKALPDANASDETPLLVYASRRSDPEIVKEILNIFPNTEVKDAKGKTAIARALEAQRLETVTMLAAAGADANVFTAGWEYETPLLLAVDSRDVAAVQTLIEAGAHVNMADRAGHTAMSCAVRNGNLDVIRTLIAAKADLEYRYKKGETVLMRVVSFGRIETVNALISAGADVNARDDSYAPVLSYADCAEKVDVLIAACADIHARDRYGCTPLMAAAKYRLADVVDALLLAGADINEKSLSGMSPLLFSLQPNRREVFPDDDLVKALLSAKANVHDVNDEGDGAILLAVGFPSITVDVMITLLRAGAKVNLRNHKGITALMRAVLSNSAIVYTMLLSHGADLDVRDNDGETALVKATMRGLTNAANVLLSAGAQWDSHHPREMNAFVTLCKGLLHNIQHFASNFIAWEDGDEVNAAPKKGVPVDDPLKLIESLIDAEADVNPKAIVSDTPLTAAAGEANVPRWIVRKLIQARAHVDARNVRGETALIAAARVENHGALEQLLEAKANVNMMDFMNTTALKHAVDNEDMEILQMLVAAGAQAEMGYSPSVSPLLQALRKPEMVRLLLDGKADVQKLVRADTKPLKNVMMRKKLDVFKLLVEAGLDLSQSTIQAADFLNMAVEKDNALLLHLLIDAKAPVDAVNPYKTSQTPLMTALMTRAESFSYGTVDTLIKAGARIDACVSDEGTTALMCLNLLQKPHLLTCVLCDLCRQTGYLEPLDKMEDRG